MRWVGPALGFAIGVALVSIPVGASAHGVAGQRFFPSTFAVDDPFMNDEFSVLVHSADVSGDHAASRTTSLTVEYSKTILPGFGLQVGVPYLWLDAAGNGAASGFGNVEAAVKYQFFTSGAHETILSVGISDEFGATGAASVGAESFSTISPTFFFGKGLGDLPESMQFLRPLAVTGVLGASLPTRRITEGAENPSMLVWGFTIQYSLMYLQSAVKDVGLGAPFNRLMAVVEFPLQTCLNADCEGRTSWTVNPGVLWVGKYLEVGAAAEIPVNPQPGAGVGVFALLHLFIDDLFPRSIGRPLFP
jgi:hypothetical protein